VAAKQAGMDLIIYNASTELGAPKQQDINRVLGGLCEGILLVLPTAQEGLLAEFESSPVPVVLINYWRNETQLPTVRGDNYEGSRAAVEHLIGLGHSRIAFITGSSYTGQSQERQRGYQDALKQAGIRPLKGLVVQGDFTQSGGFDAAKLLLSQPKLPTAIFAANDAMALGAMDAIKEKGLHIPGNISVVGFDDMPAANHAYPRLTTVRQPLSEIGAQAVRLILQRIRAHAASGEGVESLIELPSALVIRDSCGPSPEANLG
jgi:LacI family transcriptional regulator